MTTPVATGWEVTLEGLVALRAIAERDAVESLSRSETGARSGRRPGTGGDIFDLRAYQYGDDPRHLDAAASARSGRPQVRRRHEEVDRTVVLVADLRRSMIWGTRGRLRSVAAVEALALAGWAIIAAGGRVGCLVLSDDAIETLAPRPRDRAMLQIAEAFVRGHATAMAAAPARTQTLDAALLRAAAMVRPGASVLLATGMDAPGSDFARAAETVMQKCRLEVLLVQDAVERHPPPGAFTIRAAGRTARARFGASGSPRLLADLRIPTRLVDAAAPSGAAR